MERKEKEKGGEEEERKSGGEGEVIQRRASPVVSSSTHPPFPRRCCCCDEEVVASAARMLHLEDGASLLLLGGLLVERRADGLVEDVLQSFLRESAALHVAHGVDLLLSLARRLLRHHAQTLGRQLSLHALVVTKIALGADQDDRDAGSVVLDLRPPLRLHVVERVGGDDAEADQENISLRVAGEKEKEGETNKRNTKK